MAALIDATQSAKHESTITKVFVSEAVNRATDRTAQMMGALGMSEDTPVSLTLHELRLFRIYDATPEVHRAALPRRILKSNHPSQP